MTYIFEQFKTEITNPTINIVAVNDSITSKTCNIEIVLSTESAKFGVVLNGFSYTSTWEDKDVLNWVNEELNKYIKK